jgi:1,2-diacylglycerol 3-alpha-glucosyltransferase
MKIALLCSGLGHVDRGHEIFARDLFEMLKDSLDITLFKGGGEVATGERVIGNIPRNSLLLGEIKMAVSPKWASAAREQERIRVETETFAYAALRPLMEGAYDVIHCLEQEVCNILYANRHLFARTPKIVFSNGGAIPAGDLPNCDFVQEHTDYNLSRSARNKAFMIPHGVDINLFHPGVKTDFRRQHGIPDDAFVVISVGTICYWHKRMDYVIREVAAVPGAFLIIVGQECADTEQIVALGKQLMGERIVFTRMPHDKLPNAYAAADVFVLGSLFETFGIVYIEAMAMGLPVFCTDHVNQRSIVKDGVFLDMRKAGVLTSALNQVNQTLLESLRTKGPENAAKYYDLALLRQRYIDQYRRITDSPDSLPHYSLRTKVAANLSNGLRRLLKVIA